MPRSAWACSPAGLCPDWTARLSQILDRFQVLISNSQTYDTDWGRAQSDVIGLSCSVTGPRTEQMGAKHRSHNLCTTPYAQEGTGLYRNHVSERKTVRVMTFYKTCLFTSLQRLVWGLRLVNILLWCRCTGLASGQKWFIYTRLQWRSASRDRRDTSWGPEGQFQRCWRNLKSKHSCQSAVW